MFGMIAGLAAAGIGSIGSYFSGKSAADDMEGALNEMKASMGEAYSEIQGYSDEYVASVDNLINNFDPYDVEDAFNSLYESVIQPMERDFDENVLPGIQQAYSGGIMGQGAGMSGAQASAESQAQRGLSETKAQLRAGERDKAISRNYQDQAVGLQAAGSKMDAQSQAPLLKANMASQIFGGESDVIGANLAAKQSAWNTGTSLLQGAAAGSALSGSLGGGSSSLQQGQMEPQSQLQLSRQKEQYASYVKSLGR